MADWLSTSDLTGLGLNTASAAALAERLKAIPRDMPPTEQWRRVSREILTPDLPFPVHRALYERVYAGWRAADGPAPAWLPDPRDVSRTNIGRLMARRGFPDYQALRQWSVDHREAFWEEMIGTLNIRFQVPCRTILAGTAEDPQWLPGARLNIAASCFQADPATIAVLHQRPGGTIERTTYGELDTLSNRVADGLRRIELAAHDPIAIDMPMTLESVAIYLGIVKMGGVVVSISDSFAPAEIASRIRIAGARAAFTQELTPRTESGVPLYDRIVRANGPRTIVVPVNRERCRSALRQGDLLWDDFLGEAAPFEPVPVEADAGSNILFSSGTTGEPKAIPWTHATPIKCAADAWLHHDIRPGDVLAWPTNLGWMMGPWLVYAALVNHAAIALYEGPPTGKSFGEFVQRAGVTMLGLVPSLVKLWRQTRCMEGLDWSRLRAFSSTGECSNDDDMLYLMMLGGYKPVIEYCGGTEIGGGYITGTLVQPAAPATFSTHALGLDFVILDENGRATPNGEVFVIPPSIGLSARLLNHDHHAIYYAGAPPGPEGRTLRRHGDQIEALGGGYYRHHGRTDDTMKLKGIKVSSAELEQALNAVPGVHETAAIAVPPPGGGPARLIVFAVLRSGVEVDRPRLKTGLQSALRERHGSLCKIHDVRVVDALPRTASNKVMRRVLRDRYAKEETGGSVP